METKVDTLKKYTKIKLKIKLQETEAENDNQKN